ncbi:MAG: GGDEF domain-containing protein [Coriobacteriales bacterium]|nr:GGDEF domain-containing protein [Coriobacteriales bacterium]
MIKQDTVRIRKLPRIQTETLIQNALLIASVLLALVLAATISLTLYNNSKLAGILEESVESELLAACFAARDDIDAELFLSINSEADSFNEQARLEQINEKLRELRDGVGASYIYALKEVEGKYYFIFDTDEEFGTPSYPFFSEYELSPVHEEAFAGRASANVMNVDDRWGSFNTGAIPLLYNGEQIGIVSVDIEDAFVARSHQTATLDAILLVSIMIVTAILLIGLFILLLRRNRKIQSDLFYVANHDAITNLYNRYYLFNYLARWQKSPQSKNAFFALLFIDLDNFKNVNDSAGHDEGDSLLRLISQFLKTYTDSVGDTGCIECMTARIGGDEFLQIVPGLKTPEEIERWARTLLDDFAAHPELQCYVRNYEVGLSVGGALYPTQTTDYDELIRLADIAMYQTKAAGKNNYCLYDTSMGDGPEGIVLSVRKRKR